jgi:hypothetical protein
MTSNAFDHVKNQIGFCGIWCGSCVVGNGTLKLLTQKYEEIINNYGLEEWVSKDFEFREFMKGLESIQATPVCNGCLKEDGRPDCEMRTCASNKKLNDCSECPDPETCEQTELLEKMRTGARNAGLFVKTQDVNRNELLEKWVLELKSSWPSCILFLE